MKNKFIIKQKGKRIYRSLVGMVILSLLLSYAISLFVQSEVGSTEEYVFPTNAKIVKIVADKFWGTSLALLSDGSVWAWGSNRYGVLGNGEVGGTNELYTVPQRVLTSTNPRTPLNLGASDTADFKRSIAIAESTAYAVANNGDVYSWGNGYNDKLGRTNAPSGNNPLAAKVWGVGGVGTLKAKAIATSISHAAVILENDTVAGWGSGINGVLGTGNLNSSSVPVLALGVGGTGTLSAKTIVAGYAHSLAILPDDTVVGWGANTFNCLGVGTVSSTYYPNLVLDVGGTGTLIASAIDAGYFSSYAIKPDGAVFAWGYNGDGQLGDASYINHAYPNPVRNVGGGAGTSLSATAISVSNFHALALLPNGRVAAWGLGNSGQLGQNNWSRMWYPLEVLDIGGAAGSRLVASGVSAGSGSSIAYYTDSTDFAAWGNNSYGQLGIFSLERTSFPIASKVSMARILLIYMDAVKSSHLPDDFKKAQDFLSIIDAAIDDVNAAQKLAFQQQLNDIIEGAVASAERRKDEYSKIKAQQLLDELSDSVDIEDASRPDGASGANGVADKVEFQRRLDAIVLEITEVTNPHGKFTKVTDQCTNCHTTHNSGSTKLVNGKQQNNEEANYLCMTCHDGTYASSVVKSPSDLDKKYFHNQTSDNHSRLAWSNCTSCHTPHFGDSSIAGGNPNFLKMRISYSHQSSSNPTEDQYNQVGGNCKVCHADEVDTIYDQATIRNEPYSYSRVGQPQNSTDPDGDLCFRCHNQGKGATDIYQYYKPSTASAHRRLACAECHETHGADNEKLFKGWEACWDCHEQDSTWVANGGGDHDDWAYGEACNACHPNGNYSHNPWMGW